MSREETMKPPRTITKRERQVAELAAADLTDKAIARELNISIHGVDQIWRRLKTKTSTHSRTATVILALYGDTDFRIYHGTANGETFTT